LDQGSDAGQRASSEDTQDVPRAREGCVENSSAQRRDQYWSELTSREIVISQEIKDRNRYCGHTQKEFYYKFIHPHIETKKNSEIIKISPVPISYDMISRMIDKYTARGMEKSL